MSLPERGFPLSAPQSALVETGLANNEPGFVFGPVDDIKTSYCLNSSKQSESLFIKSRYLTYNIYTSMNP
jgi:hypothetical protein